MKIERLPRRDDAQMVPEPVEGARGLFRVDGTWGTIRPVQAAPGVETVGELEVIEHIEAGQPVVDTRPPEAYAKGSLPTARNVHHEHIVERRGELDPERPTVFFCNGPQCAATPNAIDALLEAGHPAGSIRWYRGGLHDWMTLGLPVVTPDGGPASEG